VVLDVCSDGEDKDREDEDREDEDLDDLDEPDLGDPDRDLAVRDRVALDLDFDAGIRNLPMQKPPRPS